MLKLGRYQPQKIQLSHLKLPVQKDTLFKILNREIVDTIEESVLQRPDPVNEFIF